MEEIFEDISIGTLPNKTPEEVSGNVPVIQVSTLIKQKSPFINECQVFVDDKNLGKKKIARHLDLLMICHSSLPHIGKFFLYLGKKDCVVGQRLGIIKHRQSSRYLLHILNSQGMKNQIKKCAQIQSMNLNIAILRLNNIKDIAIPIPPLEVQEEIANYLDDMLLHEIELSNSLEKMLEIRKKQYEFYKEQILTSEIDKGDR